MEGRRGTMDVRRILKSRGLCAGEGPEEGPRDGKSAQSTVHHTVKIVYMVCAEERVRVHSA